MKLSAAQKKMIARLEQGNRIIKVLGKYEWFGRESGWLGKAHEETIRVLLDMGILVETDNKVTLK